MPTLHLISIDSPTCGPSLLHALSRMGAEVALLGLPDPTAIPLPSELRLRHSCRGTGAGAAGELRRHLASAGEARDRLVCWDALAFETGQRCCASHTAALAVPDALLTVPPPEPVADRDTARDALGIARDRLVLIPLGSSEVVDAFEIVRIAGILAFAGEPITLLLPDHSQQIERARRFLAHHEDDWQTLIVPRTPLDHFSAADAAIIWPTSEHARRDSLARLQSDAMLAIRCGLGVVGRGAIAEKLNSLPVRTVTSTATMPETARAVRSALHDRSSQDLGGLPEFSVWADALERFINAGTRSTAQGC